MENDKLALIWQASGYLDSQLIKIYLESFGLEVFIFGESIGASYGLTNTPLGEVEIYVRKEDESNALEFLDQYEFGSGEK